MDIALNDIRCPFAGLSVVCNKVFVRPIDLLKFIETTCRPVGKIFFSLVASDIVFVIQAVLSS